jgi:hypothetical protein
MKLPAGSPTTGRIFLRCDMIYHGAALGLRHRFRQLHRDIAINVGAAGPD